MEGIQSKAEYSSGLLEEYKDEIINMYVNQKKSGCDIGKLYGCHENTILRHLRKWGITTRNAASDRYNGTHSINIHYFDKVDTEHKAYWLGYIFADGHIDKKKGLTFCCNVQDVDILEKLKVDFSCDYPIRMRKNNMREMVICSRYLGETLFNIGFTHNKSYEVDFKKILTYIPNELMHHFLRGMFDGDGSIRYYDYDYIAGYQYHFGYTGLKEVCEFVANFLKLKTKISREHNTHTYSISTSNAPMIKYIYNVLYKDATIYCERKYNTFQEVLKLIHEEKKDEVKGVSWYPKFKKWMSTCRIGKINKTIGYYNTKREAEIARLQYEYDNFGSESMQWFFFDEYGIKTYENYEVTA